MKENSKLKYETLVDALKSEQCERRTDYMHFESIMYQWERVSDIEQPFKAWAHNLRDGQKVKQYFNIHKDLDTNVLRTHLVYEARDSHVLSIFSCNHCNIDKLDLEGLNIKQSESGLKKLDYLLAHSEITSEPDVFIY